MFDEARVRSFVIRTFDPKQIPIRGHLNVLDQVPESSDPKFSLVFGERDDGQRLEVEVGPVKDDEAASRLDVLSVVGPLGKIAGRFAGSEVNNKRK